MIISADNLGGLRFHGIFTQAQLVIATNSEFTRDSRSNHSKNMKGDHDLGTFKFEDAEEEVIIMKSHDEPIPKQNRGGKQRKKSNIDQSNADPS